MLTEDDDRGSNIFARFMRRTIATTLVSLAFYLLFHREPSAGKENREPSLPEPGLPHLFDGVDLRTLEVGDPTALMEALRRRGLIGPDREEERDVAAPAARRHQPASRNSPQVFTPTREKLGR